MLLANHIESNILSYKDIRAALIISGLELPAYPRFLAGIYKKHTFNLTGLELATLAI